MRLLKLSLPLVVLIVLAQNCNPVDMRGDANGFGVQGNGNGYTGIKTYLHRLDGGACADGSIYDSAIQIADLKATLVRESCKSVPPTQVSVAVGNNEIIYGGKTFSQQTANSCTLPWGKILPVGQITLGYAAVGSTTQCATSCSGETISCLADGSLSTGSSTITALSETCSTSTGVSCSLAGVQATVLLAANATGNSNSTTFSFDSQVSNSSDLGCSPGASCYGNATQMTIIENRTNPSGSISFARRFYFDIFPRVINYTFSGRGTQGSLQFSRLWSDGSVEDVVGGIVQGDCSPIFRNNWNNADVCEIQEKTL